MLKYNGEVTMEPMKPTAKKRILQAAPNAAPEDITEYERLLSERFTVDPDLARDPASIHLMEQKRKRLKELRGKLFPSKREAQTE